MKLTHTKTISVCAAKKSLAQLRQLYFRMRDEVFGKARGAMSFNTAGLERIFKEEFTETRCMDDESYPRSEIRCNLQLILRFLLSEF